LAARDLLYRRFVSTREPSQQIGDYVVGDELGAGGMGRVFAAEHPNGTAIAVKVLHPDLALDPAMLGRLHEEARLARLVSHRNVVRVVDSGISLEGIPFLVMHRAAGTPLGAQIQARGALPLARVRKIAAQILEGLGAIHAAGLVHGDLKSDNVLVDDDDHVTIIDFGLARAQGTRPSWLADNMLSGTPEYMAPEVIRGEPMSRAADVYAAGVIIYEMLTATTPFAGSAMTTTFERHLTEDVVPPSLRTERTLPVTLEALIMRALAKQPDQRHHSARLFATALERAVPAGWIEGSLPVPRSARSMTASTRAWEPSPRRRLAQGTNRNPTRRPTSGR
jgi:serine/threonine-protein kinase